MPLEITAPRSTWDLQTRRAVLEGGVTVVYGEFTMTSETVVVEHDAEGRVDSVVAEGAVEVTREPYVAKGARAELHPDEARVVMTGSPFVEDGRNRLVGQEIELLFDAEEIRCSTCQLSLAVE
ncbi:MAG: hypothetical protein GY913_30445 [Proteobacteria bacterium]|nr:hypothetical protein [Pseudomonadota bacterium]MCP4921237.1 hypothetical protein [Pseudomonadota bacterium]